MGVIKRDDVLCCSLLRRLNHLHNLGCGGLGEDHLGVLSIVVLLQLALGGEELPTELTGEGALLLLEVLAGDVVLQGPWEAEGCGAVQTAEGLGA